MYATYIALLDKVSSRSGYGVCFPDFPGCVFAGKTMDMALESARKGVIFHIEGMQEDGDPLPSPTPLETIMQNPENKQAIPAAIKIIIPTGRTKRINICMDVDLINAIDHAARSAGRNRSEFLSDLARSMLT